MNFSNKLPPFERKHSRNFFLSTINKTRFCDHIAFLKRCLQAKLIPHGFLLNQEYFSHLKDLEDKKFTALQKYHAPKSFSSPSIKVVTIPDDLELSETERELLPKGLKFVPTRSVVDSFTLRQDIEKFFRRIKLHAHFNDLNAPIGNDINESIDEDADYFKKFKPPSSWSPKEDPFTPVGEFITKCRQQLNNLPTKIKTLKKRDDVVIKPADKGDRRLEKGPLHS